MKLQDNLDLISIHNDRLVILVKQQAIHGSSCPPHIIMEIETIKKDLKNLESMNFEFIDKLYYSIEKETRYSCNLIKNNPLTYQIIVPWQDENNQIQVIEVLNSYSSDLNNLYFQVIISQIEYENILLYESLLNINSVFSIGKAAIYGNSILYIHNINPINIKNYKDIIIIVKTIVGAAIAIHKIIDQTDENEYLIENKELNKSKHLDWCRKYFSHIINETLKT